MNNYSTNIKSLKVITPSETSVGVGGGDFQENLFLKEVKSSTNYFRYFKIFLILCTYSFLPFTRSLSDLPKSFIPLPQSPSALYKSSSTLPQPLSSLSRSLSTLPQSLSALPQRLSSLSQPLSPLPQSFYKGLRSLNSFKNQIINPKKQIV